MTKKYKIILLGIVILFFITIATGVGYFFYKEYKKANSAEVIVENGLSINYLNGQNIDCNGKEKKVNFSIINDLNEESMFHIVFKDVELESEQVTYSLYENDIKIINDAKLNSNTDLRVSSFINIQALQTKSYTLILNNPEKTAVKLTLSIEKAVKEDPNLAQTILNNNLVNKEPKTKVGEEKATIDEGIILDIDDNGNTYYFRGNVVNNYVSFGEKMWRIVRINGDGTIRLVLNEQIAASNIYDAETKKEGLNDYNNTKVYSYLTQWYKENLGEYDSYIATSNFCIDTTKEGDVLSNYFRINVSNAPTFNCMGTKNNLKIGLLTIDEVIYAGATLHETNQNFYLYNASNTGSWWTMSPVKDGVEGLYYYEITKDGSIVENATGESTKFIRPVINLQKNIEMKGTGSYSDPYKID